MSKELESFITENKLLFDDLEPSNNIWDKIEKQLDEDCAKQNKIKQMKPWYKVLKVAIFLLVTFGVALLGVEYEKYHNQFISSINPQFAKQELQFASVIELKQSQLELVKRKNPSLYKSFAFEQEKLETEYTDLKKEIKNSPNQDRVIKAMVMNLQLQIDLLNQQLSVFKEIKKMERNGKSI